MSKKILLIGGAGFIGSHLTERLLKLGHEIIVLDKQALKVSRKELSSLKRPALPRGRSLTPSLLGWDGKKELSSFNSDLEGIDVVYHLAGAINLRKGKNDAGIERAKLVCQFCKENKVKKLIFFSSGGAIYFDPESEYAKANLEIERIIQKELSSLPSRQAGFIILRLGNVYGPRQWKNGIIPQIILNKDLKIKGNGNQTRNFVYIDDLVEIAIMAMEADKNGIYNVDAGEEHSVNQVIDLVKEITGLEINPVYQEGKDISAGVLDIEKTKKDFIWKPKVSLKQGLAKTIRYYNDIKRIKK